MKPVVDVCCTCLRYDVKYYQLDDAIQLPTNLSFEGCVEFHSLIQKILKLDGNEKLHKSVICRGCHDEFRRMYWFMHQCVESENTLSQLKEVNIKIKKLKTISMIINIKKETDEFFEDEDANKWNNCSMTDNIMHEDSSSDCISVFEIVEEEYDDNIQDTNAVKELNSDLLQMEHFDTVASHATQINMDERLLENLQPIKIEKVIKEEWITNDSEPFKSVGEETVAETNSTKLSYTYNICTKKFASSLGLNIHMRRIHQTVLKYKCHKCSAAYKDLQSLKAHKQTHAPKICTQCKRYFTSLKHHRQNYHSGRTYECSVCDAKFISWADLCKHKPIHRGKYKCDQCNTEYKQKNSLRHHLLSQINVSFICNRCNARFSTKCKFAQHRLTHLNRKYACDQCDAKYIDKSGLNRHKKATHSKLKEFIQCDECNAKFGSKSGFDYHRQSHTGFMYECDQCDEKFRSKRGIEHHKISHTGLKCDLCHAYFPSGIIKRFVENSSIRNLICIQCNIKNTRNLSTE